MKKMLITGIWALVAFIVVTSVVHFFLMYLCASIDVKMVPEALMFPIFLGLLIGGFVAVKSYE